MNRKSLREAMFDAFYVTVFFVGMTCFFGVLWLVWRACVFLWSPIVGWSLSELLAFSFIVVILYMLSLLFILTDTISIESIVVREDAEQV